MCDFFITQGALLDVIDIHGMTAADYYALDVKRYDSNSTVIGIGFDETIVDTLLMLPDLKDIIKR